MALTFSEPMPVGTLAPHFELRDFEGVTYSLNDLKAGKKGILVVFTCNHCPYATASWPILIELSAKYPEIQFVAINPNNSSADPEDSVEGMQKKAQAFQIPFPYLLDPDQSVSQSYKAVCTPDPFLFKVENGEAKLFYHGRINDNWQHPVEVAEHNLEDAMESLQNEEPAPESQPPSMGCSIKWRR